MRVLERMLIALDVSVRQASNLTDLTLHLLLQRHSGEPLPFNVPHFVRVTSTASLLPLSRARNLVLSGLAGTLDHNTLVAFPDDDCWYPARVLSTIASLFDANDKLDFWFCRYASQADTTVANAVAVVPARMHHVVRNASSNTIFIRGPVVADIGRFDETLGVGTPAGGAEDLDFAIAAYVCARRSLYMDAAMIGHRDKDPVFRARYYASSLSVLARYARRGTLREFLRKILVGVVLVVRKEISIRGFAAALRSALFPVESRNGL